MKPIRLQIMSEQGVEATISPDGSQGGVDDFYAMVSVKDFIEKESLWYRHHSVLLIRVDVD